MHESEILTKNLLKLLILNESKGFPIIAEDNNKDKTKITSVLMCLNIRIKIYISV